MKNSKSLIKQEEIRKCIKPYSSVNYAVLFGSALKNMRKGSDVDILLGGRLNFGQRIKLSSTLEILLKRRVDLVFPEDVPVSLTIKALAKGFPIFIKDRQKFKNDYFKYFYLADDAVGLKRIREERIKREVLNG